MTRRAFTPIEYPIATMAAGRAAYAATGADDAVSADEQAYILEMAAACKVNGIEAGELLRAAATQPMGAVPVPFSAERISS